MGASFTFAVQTPDDKCRQAPTRRLGGSSSDDALVTLAPISNNVYHRCTYGRRHPSSSFKSIPARTRSSEIVDGSMYRFSTVGRGGSHLCPLFLGRRSMEKEVMDVSNASLPRLVVLLYRCLRRQWPCTNKPNGGERSSDG